MERILETLFGLKPGELGRVDSWAPRFAAEYNNWIVLGLVAALLGLGVLTVASYLREGENPRRVKLALAGVRILVILLVFAMLFQPGLLLRYKQDLFSTVVVLADDSISMSLKDRYAEPQARSALAKHLGVREEELGGLSRMDLVRRILARQGGPIARLAADHHLVLLRFSTAQPGKEAYTGQLATLDFTRLPEAEAVRAASEQIAQALGGLNAGGYETNLAAALRDAVDRLQGRRVAGIVLISDGQATAGDLSGALAYVRQHNWPVYAVGVGDPVPPRDVEVVSLRAPVEVRRGSMVEFTAQLSNRNCGGDSVEVRLFRRGGGAEGWADTGVSASVNLQSPADGQRGEPQDVVLRAEATELGEFTYRADVAPLEGEFSSQNNSASTKVKVSDEKIRILLVSGDAGWEFQYLRNLVLRSPERYAVSVWQQDAEREFNQEASTGMKLTELPRTKKDLFEYEVVILYDPAYTEDGFDKVFVDLLKDFVSEHHGGLCYIASNKYSDTNLTAPGPFDSLIELLPVVLDRQSLNLTIAESITQDEPTPWPVVPTALGLEHPVLRMAGDTQDNLGVWRILPGVYWSHPVVRLKPLASALAVSSDPIRRTADGSGDPCPLVAVQYFGKGRSLYVGTDETWRWRFVGDAGYHARFWSNVVDFLAAGRLQKKRIVLTTGSERFAVGEELRIRAEVYDRDYQPLDQETFVVEMIDAASGVAQSITLQRESKRKDKGHFEAALPLKQVGTFELTARRDDPEYADEVAGKTITVTLPEEEVRRPEADLATLQTIAPEGRFCTVADSDALAQVVPPGRMTVFHDEPRDVWDVPLSVVLIVLLLGVEWMLRKQYNMA